MDRVPILRDRETELAQARLGLHAAFSTLQDGNPVAALQALLSITRDLGGNEAQVPLIQRALEAFSQGQGQSTQDIAALLAQCNLDVTGESQRPADVEDASMMQVGQQSSAAAGKAEQKPILAESGREGITDAALMDGSSFVCKSCGGVVSRSRESQHHLWCSQ
ncbi:hypothetical protein WJX75_003631 [Coccomyxa subellipsoidea]|uniref:C2HC zinc finger plants domain-containing protein n=1 Tax=Coccomyxa subellipsoidea TaxID=248742 RepID=A0ABR2YF86_9CHLO